MKQLMQKEIDEKKDEKSRYQEQLGKIKRMF